MLRFGQGWYPVEYANGRRYRWVGDNAGFAVDTHRVEDLPLNGRQALQLQTLLPGVVPAAQGQAASFIALNTNLTFSINGTRPSASLYLLDGEGYVMPVQKDEPPPDPKYLQKYFKQPTQ